MFGTQSRHPLQGGLSRSAVTGRRKVTGLLLYPTRLAAIPITGASKYILLLPLPAPERHRKPT